MNMLAKSIHSRRLPFVAGLTLWLGVAHVSAQRFSLNIVAYRDADLVAGSNLIANPFNAGNNAVSNIFRDLPSGSYFLPWNMSSTRFDPTNQFVSGVGWTDGAVELARPTAGFLWLPTAQRVTFVGEPWPMMCLNYPVGASVSPVLPQYICGFCGNPGDICPLVPPEGTQVSVWNRSQQIFESSEFTASLGWWPPLPAAAPDEAVMVQAPSTFSAKAVGAPAPGAVRLGSVSRDETNLVFVFPAPGPLNYAVQMCSNLTAGYWRTVGTRTASPAAGVVTVTVPALAPEAAFYRLDGLRLLNPARNGTQFQFQFLAEAGIPYRVSRNPSLTPGPWQTVTNLVGAGLLATALDAGATGATGYYRVEY